MANLAVTTPRPIWFTALDRAQNALRTIHLSNTQKASSCCTTNALPRRCIEQLASSVEGNALFTRTKRTNTLRRTNWRVHSTCTGMRSGSSVFCSRTSVVCQHPASWTPQAVHKTVRYKSAGSHTCFGFSVSSHLRDFRNKQLLPPYPNANEMPSVWYELYNVDSS